MSQVVSPPANSALSDASVDIEAIVRRVLMQLRQEPASRDRIPSDSVTPGADTGGAGTRDQPSATTTLKFDVGVCSLAEVNAIDASIKHVLLSSRAVITPAARDELRQRGIVVIQSDARQDADGNQAKPQPGTRAINLQRDGAVAEHLFAAVKKQLRSRGVRLCNQSSLEVILSSRPATTAHHRTGTDRCVVSINRVDDVHRFMAELSPNTFVLDIAHLHVVAIATAIAAIAKPASKAVAANPRITMAGGLS